MMIEQNCSCIVVNYNAGSLLVECISSALAQLDHIVLVDNASTDDSMKAVLERFSTDARLNFQ